MAHAYVLKCHLVVRAAMIAVVEAAVVAVLEAAAAVVVVEAEVVVAEVDATGKNQILTFHTYKLLVQ